MRWSIPLLLVVVLLAASALGKSGKSGKSGSKSKSGSRDAERAGSHSGSGARDAKRAGSHSGSGARHAKRVGSHSVERDAKRIGSHDTDRSLKKMRDAPTKHHDAERSMKKLRDAPTKTTKTTRDRDGGRTKTSSTMTRTCNDAKGATYCEANDKAICRTDYPKATRYCALTCGVCHSLPDGGICPSGFELSETHCYDIDECSLGTHDCADNLRCLNTNGAFTCSCRDGSMPMDINGQIVCRTASLCQASGDPHYQTFDGEWIHFQGDCTYTMAEPCVEEAAISDWTIRQKNVFKEGKTDVSLTNYIIVTVYGIEIVLGQTNIITVNGERVNLPYHPHEDVSIIFSGKGVMVSAPKQQFTATFDGRANVKVMAGDVYAGKMCGMCGNMDGNAANDLLTKDGKSTTSAAEIGNSYATAGLTADRCTPAQDVELCGPEMKAKAEAKCSLLKAADGPFANCHAYYEAEDPFQACVMDVCTEDMSEKSFCMALDGYATECATRKGSRVNWRSTELCPLACDANCHYEAFMTACPASCAEPLSAESCALPEVEGCACNTGFILSNNICVERANCGCLYMGHYYMVGQKWTDESCLTQFSCTASREITSAPITCATDKGTCASVEGIRDCYCLDSDESCAQMHVEEAVKVDNDPSYDPEVEPLPVIEVEEEPIIAPVSDVERELLEDAVAKPEDVKAPAPVKEVIAVAAPAPDAAAPAPPARPGVRAPATVDQVAPAPARVIPSRAAAPRPSAPLMDAPVRPAAPTRVAPALPAAPVRAAPPAAPAAPVRAAPSRIAAPARDIPTLDAPARPASLQSADEPSPILARPAPRSMPMRDAPAPPPPARAAAPAPALPERASRPMPARAPVAAAPRPEAPKPVAVARPAPEPVVAAPAPEPVVAAPAPEPVVAAPAPAPVDESPAPVADEAPAPVAAAPAPAPVDESPAPVADEAPAPVDESPAPVAAPEPAPKSTATSGPYVPPPPKHNEPAPADMTDDDKYFIEEPIQMPKPKPKPLGMESGMIQDPRITASTFVVGGEPTKSRPSSPSAWQPETDDEDAWLQIDLRKPREVHGIGSLGSHSDDCWVTKYQVAISNDGVTFETLLDKDTKLPRIFDGNTDQNTWRRWCLHRYYGTPPTARYVRFMPLAFEECRAMRVELYGFRDPEDDELVAALQHDTWTKTTEGCACYYDKTIFTCPCCMPGGCQCPESNKHQCVECGFGDRCGIPDYKPDEERIDAFTEATTGCECTWDAADPERTDCACCTDIGVQCGDSTGATNQCVQAGGVDACGLKEEVFGEPQKPEDPEPEVCVPKTCD